MTKEITPALMKVLRTELDAALLILAQKHGVTMKCGNGTYSAMTAALKVEIAVGEAGTSPALVKAAEQFKHLATMYELQADWLNKSFKRHNGSTATIIGLMPKRSKFPVLVQQGEKQVLLTTGEVIACMNASMKLASVSPARKRSTVDPEHT